MWYEGDKNIGVFAVNDDIFETDTAPYEIIEFPDGMFLIATGDEKDKSDLGWNDCLYIQMDWKQWYFWIWWFPKSGMSIMLNTDVNDSGVIDEALGIEQQQVFSPLKFRTK